jgi:hypothetical protein
MNLKHQCLVSTTMLVLTIVHSCHTSRIVNLTFKLALKAHACEEKLQDAAGYHYIESTILSIFEWRSVGTTFLQLF